MILIQIIKISKLIKMILKWISIYILLGIISLIFIYFSRYDELITDKLIPKIMNATKSELNQNNQEDQEEQEDEND